MSNELSEADVIAVRDVISNSELDAVNYYEISARRIDGDIPPDEEVEGNLEVEIQQRIEDESFGVRLNAAATLPTGEAVAHVAAEYKLLNGIKPSRRTLQLFANEVAVMTVYPYVREAIASVTAKVFGKPLHVPIVERGQLVLDVDDYATSLAGEDSSS